MLSLAIFAVDSLDAEDKTSDTGAGKSFRWSLAAF